MSQFRLIEPQQADTETRERLEAIQNKLGRLPNIFKGMANAPALLAAYVGFSEALAGGRLSARLREQVALAVSERNDCQYCLAAHSAIAKMLGLTEAEILRNRQADSAEADTQAALTFVTELVDKRGHVGTSNLETVRQAGFDDGQIGELVAATVHTILTNYFNSTAETPIDFPKAPALSAS